jgi:hypothetical protein
MTILKIILIKMMLLIVPSLLFVFYCVFGFDLSHFNSFFLFSFFLCFVSIPLKVTVGLGEWIYTQESQILKKRVISHSYLFMKYTFVLVFIIYYLSTTCKDIIA